MKVPPVLYGPLMSSRASLWFFYICSSVGPRNGMEYSAINSRDLHGRSWTGGARRPGGCSPVEFRWSSKDGIRIQSSLSSGTVSRIFSGCPLREQPNPMRLGIPAEGLSAHCTHPDTALDGGGFWRVKRKANAQSTVSRPWAAIRLITTQKWLKCWSILTLVPDGYQPSNC